MNKITIFLIFLIHLVSCNTNQPKNESKAEESLQPAKVELKNDNGKFQIYVNNEPFYIKGAGLEFGRIASVAEHQGNSFRTWRTDNGKQTGKEVLDEALKNNLMVTMGIEVARERHGFDYNDEAAVKEQFERIKKEVTELKDHPALLIWAIGNELNLRATNPKVWDAVNDISKMIHEIDPNHLTTTTLAGISQQEVNYIKERCPDLDLLSVQLYGKINELPQLIKEYGWEGPYMVTEWGATGHWEVPKTSWGVPIEENSTVKAANYLKRYQVAIEADSLKCVGSYVFLWGQKQERTPTWYGTFLENGNETESVDVMHYVWSGKWPENRAPQIASYTLNDKTAYENVILKQNQEVTALFTVNDLENDTIDFKWELLPESTDLKDGGDFEKRPKAIEIKIITSENGELKFKAPEDKGAYRLFAYAEDGNANAATANIPFLVE
ncbi:glycoside hydrolase family 2 TIM barrel-domain containing protein [Lutibacter maritimus]|uniref:Glycosyl hydrolases family 2, TIM barrel domain n=1 Tax=Lutibacter maritimus TaxID=593133 RepID=A0A1I6Q8H0_9FLAO|nr:glycoside hydrolase family 2 TIM barrel-domain containing protein [Lutibacter maritimus]SFS48771.1 Glycosyl hydrolases family 2, TIM barrel domain [Lutibacter maritimus]